MSIIPCCADWMIEPVEFIHTGELVSEVRSPMLASTAELVTVRQPHMRRRTKNKHKASLPSFGSSMYAVQILHDPTNVVTLVVIDMNTAHTFEGWSVELETRLSFCLLFSSLP